jgi:metal-responsive CopG/Arc/MetJ family transcriptional regulator
MKTAISIPDKVFLKADALAKSLEISRSELYTKALTNYVAEHDNASVTERLNAVYGDQTSELDPLLGKMQLSSLKKERW